MDSMRNEKLCDIMVMALGGEGGGSDNKEFGMDMDTLLYLKWITNKDL